MIAKAPKGLMQFEIGIQSTHDETLEAITRKTDLEKIRKNVKRLIGFKNCHVHVDLIAGLPKETYAVFKKSFDETIAIEPDMLQLGFLKLLKGTKIRKEADKFYYRYASFPPYEVISNDFISSDELMRLKDIEDLVDRYYNSGAFYLSLKYIFETSAGAHPLNFLRLSRTIGGRKASMSWENQRNSSTGFCRHLRPQATSRPIKKCSGS
ncbi:hypothetical protein SDC9_148895 [bioreactor metagenome]|uniref:DUF4080 domain-containing protein n=1 Tax=bioreactor metagenome TaxID=1076179 RepID=A0A645ELZ9_9ZZZZ